MSQLHILESLDEQLRAFAESAANGQANEMALHNRGQVGANQNANRLIESSEQVFCQLSLTSAKLVSVMPQCLLDKQLVSQVPPYMLNLYRQLVYELHDLHARQEVNQNASVLQLLTMPYGAQVMRSFRQPKIKLDNGWRRPADSAKKDLDHRLAKGKCFV